MTNLLDQLEFAARELAVALLELLRAAIATVCEAVVSR